MISAVAVSRGKVFMGHAALLFEHPEDHIAELAFSFVNPEYRGLGCLNRMTKFLFEEARERRVRGLYAYAVTNHVYSQKVLHKYEINDCGLLIGTSPASWLFKGIAEENPQRISMVLSFKYLTKPDRLILYPPAHHREMIEHLYGNIQAGRHRFAVPEGHGTIFSGNESIIETGLLPSEGNADIVIRRYGANVIREVRKTLHDLCVKQIVTVELLLSLEEPFTYFAVSEFEKMGFFFAGILPGSRIGDALILQYLNNMDIDYGGIRVSSETAASLLAYIREHDPNASR
jgi:serine/threonine-protein kinase RsbW